MVQINGFPCRCKRFVCQAHSSLLVPLKLQGQISYLRKRFLSNAELFLISETMVVLLLKIFHWLDEEVSFYILIFFSLQKRIITQAKTISTLSIFFSFLILYKMLFFSSFYLRLLKNSFKAACYKNHIKFNFHILLFFKPIKYIFCTGHQKINNNLFYNKYFRKMKSELK